MDIFGKYNMNSERTNIVERYKHKCLHNKNGENKS